MSCPRLGKECNEFMCGSSVDGVCREGLQDYKVITLCGSTKFKDEFMRVQKELTLEGYIVISVGCFNHSGDVFTDEQKIMLDDMHKRKIDMADEIFDGYIGSSTRSEIEYAEVHNKKVNYLVNNKQ